LGDEITPMFSPMLEKINSLMVNFGVTELEMNQFTDSDDLALRNQALSKCVVSKVSQVPLGL